MVYYGWINSCALKMAKFQKNSLTGYLYVKERLSIQGKKVSPSIHNFCSNGMKPKLSAIPHRKGERRSGRGKGYK